jgi:COP9 signalosome complex subunit 1
VLSGKLHCASGLGHLAAGKYAAAGRAFTSVHADMGAAFNDVLSPADVATYGALCALASYDRSELAQRVAENAGFREFVGVAPPEVRRAA